ncbi:MAG TPA: hypothetical protein VGL81_13085 [Polyangiaceae bacterium]
MTLARFRHCCCLLGATLGLGAAYACSLNPQPLPPGEAPDGSVMTVGGDAGAAGFGPSEGGSFGGDAPTGTVSQDGSADGGPVSVPPEGGDAGDAGDAAGDGAADAPEGAPADAPDDGEEGGG